MSAASVTAFSQIVAQMFQPQRCQASLVTHSAFRRRSLLLPTEITR